MSSSRSPIALLLLAAVVACDAPVTAPPAIAGSASSSIADGGAVTCADIKAARGALADGNYAARTGAGNSMIVYCAGMGGAAPGTYLTLPQALFTKNFSSYYGRRQNGQFGEIITRYDKARLDLASLRIINTDRTFTSTSGVPVFGPGFYVTGTDFGRAGDCLSPYSRRGRSNIDLTGTGLALNAYFTAEGWEAAATANGLGIGWGQKRLVTTVAAFFTGGGYCGEVTPTIEGDPLYVHPAIQLRWNGPGSASPVATLTATREVIEGQPIAITATASHPANVPYWTSWDLGDGTTGSGTPPASHTYADRGTYTVTFTATDDASAPAVVTQVVTVTNPAPVVSAIPGATIYAGETYAAAGTFTDPVTESHSATVDYGAGAGASTLALAGSSFSLSNVYAAAGTYTVTVIVTDQDGGSGTQSATVTVLSPSEAATAAAAEVAALLPGKESAPLIESLTSASASIADGNLTAASGKLGAYDNKVEAMVRSRKIDAATAAILTDYSRRIRASMG